MGTASCAQGRTVPSQEWHRLLNTCLSLQPSCLASHSPSLAARKESACSCFQLRRTARRRADFRARVWPRAPAKRGRSACSWLAASRRKSLRAKRVWIGATKKLHLIHWNATMYHSIDEAVGKKNGIAIIALFVQIGKEHSGLKAVTEILQDIQYKGNSKTIPCFNPNTLLPDPLLRDYWVYEGSLTVPPCSEGVTWILFRYPLTVSQVQIEEFRRLRTHIKGAELLEGCDGILGDNFRPTQLLSDRVIRAAFQ
ncbi:carbonic anhydrase-related protein isoform X5 [Python bivittatus]|uniref:Carbonic anhydrase-related protein isoform X5 n=1 Tax=Python bivittatus TaxID=176946 RepID=A0A9F5II19_PYTBI|nr:carbonic anhydrase-related protein isoform X5 [Python bivittatus]